MQVSAEEAREITAGVFKCLETNVGDEQMGIDFLVETVKQARQHLDSSFEAKFKWGELKPTNPNDYRTHTPFKNHAKNIYATLKKYMTEGDIDEKKKERLIKIHREKEVAWVQFDYALYGFVIAAARHGYVKENKEYGKSLLDDSMAKVEAALAMQYNLAKNGVHKD